MDRKIKKYLEDIILSIQEIELFLDQRPVQYQVFIDDIMFKRAIERNIGIIGEAMSKVLQLQPDIQITNARNIKNTRNYIVHAYDSLEPKLFFISQICRGCKVPDDCSEHKELRLI